MSRKKGFLIIEALVTLLFFVVSACLCAALQSHIATIDTRSLHYIYAVTHAYNTIEKARSNGDVGAQSWDDGIFHITQHVESLIKTPTLWCKKIHITIAWHDESIHVNSAWVSSNKKEYV